MERYDDAVRGCLLGGAVGDALGASVEFASIEEIRSRHGSAGLIGYARAYGRLGAITDDTQMTLFTADGLIRARLRGLERGICHPPSVVHHAYLRWLHTQGVPWAEAGGRFAQGHAEPDGWLVREPELHHQRAPGGTCLSALRSGRMGAPDGPLNDSKGCGGVMRAAPAGLAARNPDDAFRLGAEIAAITHGHPSGFLPAGVLAGMVHLISREAASVRDALETTLPILRSWQGHAETERALLDAVELAGFGDPGGALSQLGRGWVGEEALAISVLCALVAEDLPSGVLMAVNHSGDSDSTGAIAGNLLGTARGPAAIPAQWLDDLECRAVIEAVADDVVLVFGTGAPVDPDGAVLLRIAERYPPW